MQSVSVGLFPGGGIDGKLRLARALTSARPRRQPETRKTHQKPEAGYRSEQNPTLHGRGDYSAPETLTPALAGVKCLLLVSGSDLACLAYFNKIRGNIVIECSLLFLSL